MVLLPGERHFAEPLYAGESGCNNDARKDLVANSTEQAKHCSRTYVFSVKGTSLELLGLPREARPLFPFLFFVGQESNLADSSSHPSGGAHSEVGCTYGVLCSAQ